MFPRRDIKLPKWFSNTAACIALGWNSIHSICTIRKLRFLLRVMTNVESICCRTFSAMADDREALSLVRECRELEERYSSKILITSEPEDKADTIEETERTITKKDQALLLNQGSKYYYLHLIAESISWRGLWDLTLDYGPSAITSMKNFVRVVTYPDYAEHICPLCDVQELDLYLPEHVLSCHTNRRVHGMILWALHSLWISLSLVTFFKYILIYIPVTFLSTIYTCILFSLTLVFFDFNFFICMLYLFFFTADYVACAFLFDYLYRQCPGGPI